LTIRYIDIENDIYRVITGPNTLLMWTESGKNFKSLKIVNSVSAVTGYNGKDVIFFILTIT